MHRCRKNSKDFIKEEFGVEEQLESLRISHIDAYGIDTSSPLLWKMEELTRARGQRVNEWAVEWRHNSIASSTSGGHLSWVKLWRLENKVLCGCW